MDGGSSRIVYGFKSCFRVAMFMVLWSRVYISNQQRVYESFRIFVYTEMHLPTKGTNVSYSRVIILYVLVRGRGRLYAYNNIIPNIKDKRLDHTWGMCVRRTRTTRIYYVCI
jgi:hypothetical protein